MEQIAEEADIAKATLYNYFPNKEAIIRGFMEDTVQESEQEIRRLIDEQPDTRSRLLAFLRGIHRWMEANREIVRMHTSIKFHDLVSAPENHSRAKSHFAGVLARILRLEQEAGEIRKDLPVETLALYLKVMWLVPFPRFHSSPGVRHPGGGQYSRCHGTG